MQEKAKQEERQAVPTATMECEGGKHWYRKEMAELTNGLCMCGLPLIAGERVLVPLYTSYRFTEKMTNPDILIREDKKKHKKGKRKF